MFQLACGANTVFFTSVAGFQVAQAAQFTFHGGTNGVGHGDDLLGHVHVVFKGRRGLAVAHQRTVHHHRAKAQIQCTTAHFGGGAVVLVHHQRDVGVHLGCCLDQVLDEGLTSVLACTGRCLQDHGSAHFVRRRHHGLHLFQVVDVKGGDAIAVFSGMVEHFAHRDQRHGRGPVRLNEE